MKLFASDYDGTLLYAKHIMPEDLKAIQEWKDALNKAPRRPLLHFLRQRHRKRLQ